MAKNELLSKISLLKRFLMLLMLIKYLMHLKYVEMKGSIRNTYLFFLYFAIFPWELVVV